jgi:xanthine/uracil permease
MSNHKGTTQKDNQMKQKQNRMGTAIALGAAVGTALGVANGNAGSGFFWGMIIAIILNAIFSQQETNSEDTE